MPWLMNDVDARISFKRGEGMSKAERQGEEIEHIQLSNWRTTSI